MTTFFFSIQWYNFRIFSTGGKVSLHLHFFVFFNHFFFAKKKIVIKISLSLLKLYTNCQRFSSCHRMGGKAFFSCLKFFSQLTYPQRIFCLNFFFWYENWSFIYLTTSLFFSCLKFAKNKILVFFSFSIFVKK